jgi:hypothetical protein
MISLENNPPIFICFSSKDETVARDVVQYLEAAGLKCWISSRDVPPGQNYQETIVNALEHSKGVVFLFSENSNMSGEIKKELSLSGGMNIPVFPLRLSPVTPGGALRYELATRQWIDLFPNPEQALARLVETIRRVFEAPPAPSSGIEAIAKSNGKDAPVSGSRTPATEASGGHASAPIVPPDSAEFEAIRGLLARHIGPIAKVLVQKAAKEARTPEEFCEQLATHVGAASERAAFLQTARARLAAKK